MGRQWLTEVARDGRTKMEKRAAGGCRAAMRVYDNHGTFEGIAELRKETTPAARPSVEQKPVARKPWWRRFFRRNGAAPPAS
jgi:hypothetical protein